MASASHPPPRLAGCATDRNPDQRLAALAARQHGLLTREQCRQCGLTRDQIDGRVATGRLLVVGRGVYRAAGVPVTWQANIQAAVLAGPTGTVASHLSAAALLGLRPRPRCRTSRSLRDVARAPPCRRAPQRARPSRPVRDRRHRHDDAGQDAVRLRRPPRVRRPRRRRRRRPCARTHPLRRRARRHPAEAGQRPGRRGEACLRAVLDVWSHGIVLGSVPEARLGRRLHMWGFGDAVPQHRVHGESGQLIAVFDWAWPDALVGSNTMAARATPGAPGPPRNAATVDSKRSVGMSSGSARPTYCQAAIGCVRQLGSPAHQAEGGAEPRRKSGRAGCLRAGELLLCP